MHPVEPLERVEMVVAIQLRDEQIALALEDPEAFFQQLAANDPVDVFKLTHAKRAPDLRGRLSAR